MLSWLQNEFEKRVQEYRFCVAQVTMQIWLPTIVTIDISVYYQVSMITVDS